MNKANEMNARMDDCGDTSKESRLQKPSGTTEEVEQICRQSMPLYAIPSSHKSEGTLNE